MTVNVEKLVKMGEQIRDNMAYTDDSEVVARRITDHLDKFWDPRMLEAIKQFQSQNPEGLSRELSAAVAALD